MNVLLIFFAIPVAIIILSIILEKYLNCPLSVAGIFFSILLVTVFYLGITAELIVALIVYTILSFISAVVFRYYRLRMENSCYNNDSAYIANGCMQCSRYR